MPPDPNIQNLTLLSVSVLLLFKFGDVFVSFLNNLTNRGKLGNIAIENDQRRVLRLEVQREEDRKTFDSELAKLERTIIALELKIEQLGREKIEDRKAFDSELARQGAQIAALLKEVQELKVQLAKYQDSSGKQLPGVSTPADTKE